jgi:hypothetical protein
MLKAQLNQVFLGAFYSKFLQRRKSGWMGDTPRGASSGSIAHLHKSVVPASIFAAPSRILPGQVWLQSLSRRTSLLVVKFGLLSTPFLDFTNLAMCILQTLTLGAYRRMQERQCIITKINHSSERRFLL